MKPFVLAVAVLLIAPSVAHAEPATITSRDVPLHGVRSLQSSTLQRFDLVGLHWQGRGSVFFRTRSLDGKWSGWEPAAPEAEDLPDHPSQTWRLGNPYWTGPANAIAYRTRGRVTRLRSYFVWSPVGNAPPRTLSIAGSPQIIPRSAWGADESIRRAPPLYASSLQFALIHHTAGSNNYSPAQSAAIVRGIEVYHVKGNGWNDIGYNFLVDKYGQIFEGRYGGMEKDVIGAHALGFNDGSVGVAVLGTYQDVAPPPAAMTALANLLAWRLDIAHVDPLSKVTVVSAGNPKYPAGTPVVLRAISGHRDTGPTTCPGNALYIRIDSLAARAASIGLPKLYAPIADGGPGGLVTFRARLSAVLPWTVTVTDPDGHVVSTGEGMSTDVYWTWNASTAPQARYTWQISAGAGVTPATGSVGTAPVPLTLTNATAKPATLWAGKTSVSYKLSTTANVIATLKSADGRVLSTLFQQQLKPGSHSFSFSVDGVSDGKYAVVLLASNGKATVSTDVPITVDRTVSSFAVNPADLSPNGDGRLDTTMFTFHLSGSAHIRMELRRGTSTIGVIADGDSSGGDRQQPWDGTIAGRRVADGRYQAVLTATSALGATTHAVPVTVDTTAPKLRAISFRRVAFRISEPARVDAVVNGRRVVRSVRARSFALPHPRTVRRVVVSATDAAGNVSRTLHFP